MLSNITIYKHTSKLSLWSLHASLGLITLGLSSPGLTMITPEDPASYETQTARSPKDQRKETYETKHKCISQALGLAYPEGTASSPVGHILETAETLWQSEQEEMQEQAASLVQDLALPLESGLPVDNLEKVCVQLFSATPKLDLSPNTDDDMLKKWQIFKHAARFFSEKMSPNNQLKVISAMLRGDLAQVTAFSSALQELEFFEEYMTSDDRAWIILQAVQVKTDEIYPRLQAILENAPNLIEMAMLKTRHNSNSDSLLGATYIFAAALQGTPSQIKGIATLSSKIFTEEMNGQERAQAITAVIEKLNAEKE